MSTSTTTTGTAPAQDSSAGATVPRGPAHHPVLLHGGIDLRHFFSGHVVAAGFPMAAGVALFGWRAMLVVAVTVGSTLAGLLVWRRIGRRGASVSLAHGAWLAAILALTLPAHLASKQGALISIAAPWPLVPAAGLTLAFLLWLFGGVALRMHPVPIVHLLIVVVGGAMLVPHHVLQKDRLVLGDVLDVRPGSESDPAPTEPWAATRAPKGSEDDALWRRPAAERLTAFTRGQPDRERAWLSLDGLVRDRMPPLEDLIIGGQPRPIGTASAVAVIMGGLFLLYRGLIDFRVPLLMVLSAYAALLVLPIPLVITEGAAPQWHWLALRQPSVGWSLAITFAHYELMAGPLLFVAFFLATAPGVRPMTRRGQAVYALVAGAGAGALQLYLSVSYGPYLALLAAGLLTPLLDHWLRPRPLV